MPDDRLKLAIDEHARYINVSRFGNFLTRSITRGLAWTAFEPHGEPLYARVGEQIGAFRRQLWDAGVLGGAPRGSAEPPGEGATKSR